jgi:hypothetical protein
MPLRHDHVMQNPASSLIRVRPRLPPIETPETFRCDRRKQQPLSIAEMPATVGAASRLGRLTMTVRSVLARIDLSHFPGSCCG